MYKKNDPGFEVYKPGENIFTSIINERYSQFQTLIKEKGCKVRSQKGQSI